MLIIYLTFLICTISGQIPKPSPPPPPPKSTPTRGGIFRVGGAHHIFNIFNLYDFRSDTQTLPSPPKSTPTKTRGGGSLYCFNSNLDLGCLELIKVYFRVVNFCRYGILFYGYVHSSPQTFGQGNIPLTYQVFQEQHQYKILSCLDIKLTTTCSSKLIKNIILQLVDRKYIMETCNENLLSQASFGTWEWKS